LIFDIFDLSFNVIAVGGEAAFEMANAKSQITNIKWLY